MADGVDHRGAGVGIRRRPHAPQSRSSAAAQATLLGPEPESKTAWERVQDRRTAAAATVGLAAVAAAFVCAVWWIERGTMHQVLIHRAAFERAFQEGLIEATQTGRDREYLCQTLAVSHLGSDYLAARDHGCERDLVLRGVTQ